MKFNPFRPGSIVTPGMFAGRGQELQTLEAILFQTKHGNPQHFLVSGERGIGKSSLLYYLQLVGSGTIKATDSSKFKFLTISLELEPGDTFEHIAKKVGSELNSVVSQHATFKRLAMAGWEFLKRWEGAGIKYNSDESKQASYQLMDELCQTFVDTVEKMKEDIDGCLVLIDEADKPPVSADVGAFSKLFTERLTKRNAHNVALGLAGVTGIVGKLRQSHESSPRIFHTISLEPLTHADRVMVIQRGLAEAKAKTGKTVTITSDAENAISSQSEGYPNFVQQFAFCAFDSDLDDNIGLEDVSDGAFKKDGAFHQLGQKYFSELYFDQIGSDEYREVLRAMAEHSDTWITKEQLKKSVKLKPAILNNAITALKKRGIIIPQPGKQGVYKLPNKSFAVWIKAFTQDQDLSQATTELESVEEKDGAIGRSGVSRESVPMPTHKTQPEKNTGGKA